MDNFIISKREHIINMVAYASSYTYTAHSMYDLYDFDMEFVSGIVGSKIKLSLTNICQNKTEEILEKLCSPEYPVSPGDVYVPKKFRIKISIEEET